MKMILNNKHLSMLEALGVGQDKAITVDRLQVKIGTDWERTQLPVHSIAHELNEWSFPVVSSAYGYYLAEDDVDLERYAVSLVSHAREELQRVEYVMKCHLMASRADYVERFRTMTDGR